MARQQVNLSKPHSALVSFILKPLVCAGKMINDFTQLFECPKVISGEAHLRMITKFYKLRDVRQHVCRLRKILANPPKRRSNQSNKCDFPENKTPDSSQPKAASSKESNATTKNNKGKAAKQKTPKVIIHKSPDGPGLFNARLWNKLFAHFRISHAEHFAAVLLLSKKVLKQQANRRKKKVAQLKPDAVVCFKQVRSFSQ